MNVLRNRVIQKEYSYIFLCEPIYLPMYIFQIHPEQCLITTCNLSHGGLYRDETSMLKHNNFNLKGAYFLQELCLMKIRTFLRNNYVPIT